jgi:hypothetical protein
MPYQKLRCGGGSVGFGGGARAGRMGEDSFARFECIVVHGGV